MRVKIIIFCLLLGSIGTSLWWQNTAQAEAQVVSQVFLAVTPTAAINSETGVSNGPPIWMTLSLLGFCCVLSLILGVFVLGFVVRAQNMKAMKNQRDDDITK